MEVRQTEEFRVWLQGLRSVTDRARIAQRIDRLASGNPGDVEPVGGGVSELRLHFGPGYRLYFVRRGAVLIVLLCGGDKSTQGRDIARARRVAGQLED